MLDSYVYSFVKTKKMVSRQSTSSIVRLFSLLFFKIYHIVVRDPEPCANTQNCTTHPCRQDGPCSRLSCDSTPHIHGKFYSVFAIQ
jgi:hypothetical protein